MRHLNLEHAKLERRIAPGLVIGGIDLGGGGGNAGGTSNGSSGSCDGTSRSGSHSSKVEEVDPEPIVPPSLRAGGRACGREGGTA